MLNVLNTLVPLEEVTPSLAKAMQLLQAGRPAEAIPSLWEAARLSPANAAIHHDLGLACLEAGQLPEAVAAFEQAILADPQYADAYFRLGIAYEKLGNVGAAVVAYDRATTLRPALTEAWFRAGALVYTLGHRDEAIGCFRRAAETGGKTSLGFLGKARALLTEDRNDEAERVLRKAVAVHPQDAMAHELLGNLLAEFGRFEEARQSFERAVAIAPLLAGCYYELVRCRPVTAEDGLLERMETALATPGLEAGQRIRLHLALGKAGDDLASYELAMQHFDAADEVRRASGGFDRQVFASEIERMIERTTPEWIESTRARGNPDPKPIFILGMPRSGTTLVEQIISNHPEVGAGDELQFWNQRGTAWQAGASGEDEATFLAEAARAYLRVLRGVAPKAARVTDKMPFNFLWAGLIHATFPGATIIHCRRNRIDTALSIHQTHFHPDLAFPTGGEDLVAYYRAYQRLVAHWRRVLPAERFLEIDYEELTGNPEPLIRRMIGACGLAWDDRCLSPETNRRAVRTPSKWQARQPIYRNSVARWRRYEPWLGPLRALLAENEIAAG